MMTIRKGLFLDGIRALLHAKKFSEFIHGVPVTLPTGEELFLKITRSTLIPRHENFSFSSYTFLTEISGGGISESGCGESDHKLIALQKSISEAMERVIFRALKGSRFGTETSNGWAAHFDRSHCEHVARMELLERDAALTHWLTETPFLEIDLETTPRWVGDWAKASLSKTELPYLRVLLSTAGHIPTISTLFQREDGMGVVSHGAAQELESSLRRALAETGRIAKMVSLGSYKNSSKKLLSSEVAVLPTGPLEQAALYAYHCAFPSWIFGENISWTQAHVLWFEHYRKFTANRFRYEFHEILRSPLSVGYCTSPDVQSLFFGRTSDALKRGAINATRMGRAYSDEKLNMSPHFVA